MEDVKLKVLENYAKNYLDNVTFTEDGDGVYIGSDDKRYIVYTEDEVAAIYSSYEDDIAEAAEIDTYHLLRMNGCDKWADYIEVNREAISDDTAQADMADILNVKCVLEESIYYEGEYYTICEE
jgi:hypothetical protein